MTQQLSTDSHLSGRISAILPAGTSVNQASAGFKNLGAFVATAHVAHNLDIPFNELKAKVVAGESLGKAIHGLRADADAKAEVKKANRQSREDVQAGADIEEK
jgi:hypothetical protein